MWIHDFLSERKQNVVVAQNQSLETSVISGVPQSYVFQCYKMLQSCASIRNRPHLLLTTLLMRPSMKLHTKLRA